LKKFIFILLSVICGVANAQQSNHMVVQGFFEQFDIEKKPYSDAIKKTSFYDINFNHAELKVDEISAKKIWEVPHSPLFYLCHKLGQGYQTISNSKGELIAFIYCNTLFNKNGDSIGYIPQIGGKRGVASVIGASDTFTLYYVCSKNKYNGVSFEMDLLSQPRQQLHSPYSSDTFLLVAAQYYNDKLLSYKSIDGFTEFGDLSLMQSNVNIFKSTSKENIIQFVWNQHLYEFNITNNYNYRKKRILHDYQVNRNYKSYLIWYDYNLGSTSNELITSPSGRWTVFNWYYDHFDINGNNPVTHVKYSMSKLILIDNENDLDFELILSDSGNINTENFKYWKNCVFTKYDSTFLVPQFAIEYKKNFKKESRILLEVDVRNRKANIQSYNIDLDSNYFGKIEGGKVIKDYVLSSNGNIYVLLNRAQKRLSSYGDSVKLRQIEIGKLIKKNNAFTVENPIKVLAGATIGYDNPFNTQLSFDKIFFPATPIPYHYINFTYKSICNDLTHEFTNETDTNWFDHFQWFWGDGDSSKTLKSQTKIRHKYTKPGKYKVLLKSITAYGGWVWYSDSIEVLPEPIAKYYTKNTVGCQWIAVEFSDSSILQKKSHTWKWDFGDGTDTSLTSPSNIMPKNKSIKHTYTTSGKFNVQLQVSDGRCIDTFNAIQNISILPAPRPGISIDKTTGCSPLNVEFGRLYTDPTDSTIYHFKPSLVPNNRFDQAINKVLIQQSGKFILYQKLYGPSGCITQDSVKLAITPGITAGYKPQLKRSTVINNTTTLTEWKSVPYAKSYQVYRNGQLHAVVSDTFFKDYLSAEIDQSHTYEIQAKDSCDNLGGLKSNIGKTIFLKVTEVEPASKSDFPTALLTWSPYEDWTTNGGVKRHESFGTYDIEISNWQPLNNQKDTQFSDKDFVQPKKFQKCYIVKAQSSDLAYESQSNSFCLGYQATLFAPSAFTPNGDGLNDEFEIFNYGFDHFTLTIFNSWGQKIYEQEGSNAIWKPAADMPLGVYVYTIKASRKKKEYTYSSTVTLLK